MNGHTCPKKKPVPSVQPIPRSESCHHAILPLVDFEVIFISPSLRSYQWQCHTANATTAFSSSVTSTSSKFFSLAVDAPIIVVALPACLSTVFLDSG